MNDDIKITDSRKIKNLRLMTRTGRHLHIAEEVSSRNGLAIWVIIIAGLLIISGLLALAYFIR